MKESTSCICTWNHQSSIHYEVSTCLWFCTFLSLVVIIILSNKFHLHLFHFLVIKNHGEFDFIFTNVEQCYCAYSYLYSAVLSCHWFCFVPTCFAGMRWKDHLNIHRNCMLTYQPNVRWICPSSDELLVLYSVKATSQASSHPTWKFAIDFTGSNTTHPLSLWVLVFVQDVYKEKLLQSKSRFEFKVIIYSAVIPHEDTYSALPSTSVIHFQIYRTK